MSELILNQDELEELTVDLYQLYLDPNNPRFSDESDTKIDESKIIHKTIQDYTLQNMKKFGLTELIDNIKQVGFLPIDRIVVRPIKNEENKYVIVEGNRRLASLIIINNQYNNQQLPDLPESILSSILRFKVLNYLGDDLEIAWIVQGIRHISGVRDWPQYQQAQVLVKVVNKKQISISQAAKSLGIGPIIAGRLYRSYYGLHDVQNDDEYGDYMKYDHFSYFHEVIFRKDSIKNWLGWNEDEKVFENKSKLKTLLSLFVETPDNPEPKITRAMELRDIVAKAMVEHNDLFIRFIDDETMSVDELQFEMGKKNKAINEDDWYSTIDSFLKDIIELPVIKIENRKEDFIELIDKLESVLNRYKIAFNALLGNEDD